MTMMLAIVWLNDQQRMALKPMPDNAYTRLHTAICISLFTDARCNDDELPAGDTDKRGWWGDMALPNGESLGSKLWLLKRQKLTQAAIGQARGYVALALQWLVDSQWVIAISVDAERWGNDGIAFAVKYRLATDQPWQSMMLNWRSHAI